MSALTTRPTELRFPVDAFPARLALLCEAIAEHTQTAPEMAACAMLGALSAVSLGVQVDAGGWREELALFILVVMGPAQRKSSVMRLVLDPLERLDRERRQNTHHEVQRATTRLEALERRKQQLLSLQARAPDAAERDQTLAAIDEIDREISAIGEPHHFRRLASDATPEALGSLLAAHRRIAVLASEGAFLDNLLGRYSEGSPNLHLTCQCYEGESTVIDRRRGAEDIVRPLMTIMLAVQEHHLPKLIEHPVAQSQGLVSRFLFAAPDSKVGSRAIHTPPVPHELLEEWSQTLRNVENLIMAATSDFTDTTPKNGGSVGSVACRLIDGSESLLLLSFSPEARAAFDAHRQVLEPMLGDGGELSHVSAWANRNPGRLARIAGILHLAEGHGPATLISEQTLMRASRMMLFFEDAGRAALEQPSAIMRKALRVLAGWDGETISVHQLHRTVFNAHGPAAPVRALAADLVDRGLLQAVERPDGKPGRPSDLFYIDRDALA